MKILDSIAIFVNSILDFIWENIFENEEIRIVSKEELDKHPEMFVISLQEILDGKEPIRIKDRRIE